MSESRTPVAEPSPAQSNTPETTNGLGLAGLIIGAVALLGSFIPFLNYVTGFVALVGLVLAIIGLTRKGKPKALATAGTITSALALILSMVLATAYTAGFITAVDEALPDTSVQEPSEADPAEEDTEAEPEPAEDSGSDIGTRSNPAPLGTVIELSSGGTVEYEIVLGTPVLDAGAAVAEANMFNEAAPAGHQFVMIPVTFTYVGEETGTPWVDVAIEFVTASGTTHTSSDVSVVEPAPTIMDINEMYNGASSTANVVIAVPSDGIAGGAFTVSDSWGFGDKFFVAVQ